MTDLNAEEQHANIVDCKECAERINTQHALYIVCNGPCKSAFHTVCVCVSRHQLDLCDLSKGFVWMCNSCLQSFRNWKNSQIQPTMPNAIEMNNDISQLKSQVSRIINLLEKNSSSESSFTGSISSSSTPVAVSKLLNGTNTSYECIGREQDGKLMETMERSDSHGFPLLLTNINTAVSEEDIKSMVCRCLDVPVEDCESVTKLISKHADCRFVDYVSFKVVIKWKWKSLALQASTWPTGIKFREFVCRRTSSWKP